MNSFSTRTRKVFAASAAVAVIAGGVLTAVPANATEIGVAPVFTTASSLPTAVVGTDYNFTVQADGNPAELPKRMTIENFNTLPEGISFNEETFALFGAPKQAGSYNFNVLAYDDEDDEAQLTVTLVIEAAPFINTFDTIELNRLEHTFPFSQTVTSNGADSVAVIGNLPAGITADVVGNTVTLSGTATAPGDYSFSLVATKGQETDTQTFSGTVHHSLISFPMSPVTPDARVGFPFSYAFESVNGTEFALGSELPEGVTFDVATATFSGTPTKSGNVYVTIKVGNPDYSIASGNNSSRIVAINVKAGIPAITTTKLPALKVGETVSFQLAGSEAGYWTSTEGIPAGLTVGLFTGIISGTPTVAGPYSFTISAGNSSDDTTDVVFSGSVAAADPKDGGNVPTPTPTPTPTPSPTPTPTPTTPDNGTNPPAPAGIALVSTYTNFAPNVNIADIVSTYVITDLTPWSPVTITAHSTPRVLFSGVADANGTVRAVITIPADLGAGAHRLIVEGTNADGTALTSTSYFSITANGKVGEYSTTAAVADPTAVAAAAAPAAAAAAAAAELPSTGFAAIPYLAVAALSVLAGAALMIRRRKEATN